MREANESNIILILRKTHGYPIVLFQNMSLGTQTNKIKVGAISRLNSLFEINSLKDIEYTLQIPL